MPWAAAPGTAETAKRCACWAAGPRALGGWRRIVTDTFVDDAEVHFASVMRPQLQRLFAARLAERHGVAMYRNPQRASALVGAELWPWIDPGATAPRATLPEPVLRALLDRLEAL